MILLFSDRFGKFSAGTFISETGKSKSALAMRRFTRGLYHVNESKGYKSITSAETIKSYYAFGENIEKYASASFVLEFTEKMLPEELPAPDVYELLVVFLSLLERRKQDVETLTLSYMVKALQIAGVFPEPENFQSETLLSALDFDIVGVLIYLMENPLEGMERLTLDDSIRRTLFRTMRRFAEFHLDIGPLKSESVF
jgi:DNA repair protein RecO (recombination protein O)